MKRIIAFLLLFAVSLGVKFGSAESVQNYDGLEKVVFVCGKSLEDADIQVVQNGNMFYITTLPENAKKVHEELENVEGYCLYFSSERDSEKLINEFVDFCASDGEVANTRVVTGFNSSYRDFRYVDGKKVNVQIAFTEDAIIVGFPLILTGF